jgi:hypothetical protein
MPLPSVEVTAHPGEEPAVRVDGVPLPGVLSVQVSAVTGQVPHVSLVLAAGELSLDVAGQVRVMRTGPSATEFADALDVKRLERDALDRLDDSTQGEAFAAAVRAQASDYDDRG